MNRIAFRNFVLAMLHATQQRRASLPTGTILTGLDMLARAQYLEGLLGERFNTRSRAAGSSIARAQLAINQMLQEIYPQINLASDGAEMWNTAAGATGLYRSAWQGANKIFSKTQSAAIGRPVEASDLLSANMLKFLETPSSSPDLSADEIEDIADTATPSEKEEVLERQMDAAKDYIIGDVATETGNFFWSAGFSNRKRAVSIVNGDVTMDRLGGQVARFAMNAAIKVIAKLNTESRAFARALKIDMLPGEGESGDFDLSSVNEYGWAYLVQHVLSDPLSEFSADMLNWMLSDIKYSDMTPLEKSVMTAYVERIVEGRPMSTDPDFAEEYNAEIAGGLRDRPLGSTKPLRGPTVAVIRSRYLKEVGKRLHADMPQFLRDAENQLYLMNVMRGRIRGKGASLKRASDRNLRSSLIRLAHQNPPLRPYLFPILSRS